MDEEKLMRVPKPKIIAPTGAAEASLVYSPTPGSAEAGMGGRLAELRSELLRARALRSGVSSRQVPRPLPVLRPRGIYGSGLKRGLDLAVVLAVAPMALALAVALLVWVTLDPRSGRAPALYGQVRVGRGGRRFTCWKIRTMVPDAEAALADHLARDAWAAAEWSRRQKLASDPRVIPAGRFLRASSLDELPQLWNVLVGDMSLVGPRPFTPEQRRLYPLPDIYETLRPGLTGRWQTGPRGEGADFAGRAAEDARYRRELSLAADLRILARTCAVVLQGRGQ